MYGLCTFCHSRLVVSWQSFAACSAASWFLLPTIFQSFQKFQILFLLFPFIKVRVRVFVSIPPGLFFFFKLFVKKPWKWHMLLLLHHQYEQWERNAILEYIYKMYNTICFIATENVLLFSVLSLQCYFILKNLLVI